MSDEDLMKLRHLPGTTLTPEVVLHRTLNKLPRIKAVAIVIQWDDDSMDTDWSQMRRSDLFMAAHSLTSDVHALIRGDTSVEER